jgi:hypothetical protein
MVLLLYKWIIKLQMNRWKRMEEVSMLMSWLDDDAASRFGEREIIERPMPP